MVVEVLLYVPSGALALKHFFMIWAQNRKKDGIFIEKKSMVIMNQIIVYGLIR